MFYQNTSPESDIISSLNNFIDNNNISYLDPNDLRPSLKSHNIPEAIDLIQEFIDNPNKDIQFYGATSNGMTNHIIYRRNGYVYNAFCSMTHGIYAVSLLGNDIIKTIFPYFEYF